MYRTTAADVRQAFAAFKRAAERAGINRKTGWSDDARTLTADDLILTTGSPTYGRPWNLMFRDPGSGAHYSTPWGTVGTSKSEVARTLRTIAATIDETADALGGYPERG